MSKSKIIENLENQLFRLVDQVKDLKECKEELPSDEFGFLKDEIVEQSKKFSENLDRTRLGDLVLNSKLFELKLSLRKAIGDVFTNYEMDTIFGVHDEKLLQQIIKLEEEYKLKLIDQSSFMNKKSMLLVKLQEPENEEKLSEDTIISPEQDDSVSDIFSQIAQSSGSEGA